MKMTRLVKVFRKQLPFLMQAVNSHGKSESLEKKLEKIRCKIEFECTSAKSKYLSIFTHTIYSSVVTVVEFNSEASEIHYLFASQ